VKVSWFLKLIKSQVVSYVSWLKINDISGIIYAPIIRADVITGSTLPHLYSNLLHVFKTEHKPVGAKGLGLIPSLMCVSTSLSY
jgi:hypothetical protein